MAQGERETAPGDFRTRVRLALADDHLRGALDRASTLFMTRRQAGLATLENADAVRDAARAGRLRALAHLAEHLEQFETKLVANGAQVHWADSPDEANRIVAGIAAATGTNVVVKSKSMVSEETHLNAALEQAGIEVVETDLGEYIVQLANDRPSHIIAPIIHLTRQDVGRVMEQQLHVPYTDDTQALAATARERLRDAFLRADMGITGANFGVVETGTICLVTNEGNGRMVTTLPRIHVAIMGIEKLVPTLTDLDRCLKVLARSATGQKLTVYTTMIRGPRAPGESDGPEELHVVLLDNGRSRILAGETAEILACIRCGACLNACPVYRTIGGHAYGDTYQDPMGSILTPGLRGLHEWRALPDASSLCGACREVCPVRIDIPRMLLALRSAATKENPRPRSLAVAMKGYAWVSTRPRLYRSMVRIGGWWLRRLARDGWIRKAPGLAGGWTRSRDLRAPAVRNFQQRWQARQRQRGGAA